MYHSVTFGSKNTWTDWGLVPVSRPLFNPPKRKTNYVDIPGASSALDLSEALTGFPLYSDREGSMEFYVMNPATPDWNAQLNEDYWVVKYSEISSYLNGMKRTAILEDDPMYYYTGSFWVDSWKSDKDRSKIVIAYRVEPYKLKTIGSSLTLPPETPRHIGGENHLIEMMPVVPTMAVSGGQVSVKFINKELGINKTYDFNNGEYKPSWMIFSNLDGLTDDGTPWNVEIQNYSGAGTITLSWINGRL